MTKLLALGLDEAQLEMVREVELAFELLDTDCYTDAIAQYADLTIINPESLTDEELEVLGNFYREIDPAGEQVIVTGSAPALEGISFVSFVPEFFDEGFNRTIAVMKRVKETQKQENFSRRLANCFRVLKLIEGNPGISTAEISRRSEIPEASVRRYIRSLQAALILIEYRNRGWYLLLDPSETL